GGGGGGGDGGGGVGEGVEGGVKAAEGLAVGGFADAPAPAETGPGKKTAKIHDQSGPERIVFSEKFACPVSGFTIPEIEPRLFSFNNPFGACPACGGLGVEQHIDAELVIPDKDRTLRAGAIAPWAKSSSPYYVQTLQALGKHYKFTLDTKWKDLPKKTQDAILYGSKDDAIKFTYDDGTRSYQTTKPFEGVVTNLDRRWRETESDWAREGPGAAGRVGRRRTPTPPPRGRPAAATASSPRRCASRSRAGTSARSPSCRSSAPASGSRSCPRSSRPSRTRSRCGCSRRSA